MTHLAAVAPVLPPYRYAQHEITAAFGRLVTRDDATRATLERLHASVCVDTRHLALPLEDYEHLDGFAAANDAFVATAVDLGTRSIATALAAAGLEPADVDLVLATSVTGVAAPSIEARIAPRVGLRPDVKRLPVFGLGCVAGAAGIARVHDYLTAYPDEVAVLLSVELCSLTVQRDDDSVANLVASGLFGDGAAAVVAVGARRAARMGLAGPRVLATRSRLYPDSERVMGWDIGGSGFKIVLAKSVAEVVQQYLGDDVRDFLLDHDLKPDDIATWVAHPGGPKVLEAMQEALGLPRDAFALTWESLRALGNLSSTSVLHVLSETMRGDRPAAGSPGLLMAMGPGFCSELVLLRW